MVVPSNNATSLLVYTASILCNNVFKTNIVQFSNNLLHNSVIT